MYRDAEASELKNVFDEFKATMKDLDLDVEEFEPCKSLEETPTKPKTEQKNWLIVFFLFLFYIFLKPFEKPTGSSIQLSQKTPSAKNDFVKKPSFSLKKIDRLEKFTPLIIDGFSTKTLEAIKEDILDQPMKNNTIYIAETAIVLAQLKQVNNTSVTNFFDMSRDFISPRVERLTEQLQKKMEKNPAISIQMQAKVGRHFVKFNKLFSAYEQTNDWALRYRRLKRKTLLDIHSDRYNTDDKIQQLDSAKILTPLLISVFFESIDKMLENLNTSKTLNFSDSESDISFCDQFEHFREKFEHYSQNSEKDLGEFINFCSVSERTLKTLSKEIDELYVDFQEIFNDMNNIKLKITNMSAKLSQMLESVTSLRSDIRSLIIKTDQEIKESQSKRKVNAVVRKSTQILFKKKETEQEQTDAYLNNLFETIGKKKEMLEQRQNNINDKVAKFSSAMQFAFPEPAKAMNKHRFFKVAQPKPSKLESIHTFLFGKK